MARSAPNTQRPSLSQSSRPARCPVFERARERRRSPGQRIGWLPAILALTLFVAHSVAQPTDQTPIAAAPPMARQAPDAAIDSGQAPVSTIPPATSPATSPADAPVPHEGAPRWLEAVREQRRALQERRRAQHQARRRAIDPVRTARQEAMEQDFLRRRQEMRDLMAEERRMFLNLGPWLTPWPPPPGGAPPTRDAPSPEPEAAAGAPPSESPRSAYELPEWDNGWYFRGW